MKPFESAFNKRIRGGNSKLSVNVLWWNKWWNKWWNDIELTKTFYLLVQMTSGSISTAACGTGSSGTGSDGH